MSMFESLPPKRGYRWNPDSRKWVSIRGERVLTYVMSALAIAIAVGVVGLWLGWF